MPATTLSEFPRELRDMIWSWSTAVQYQHIVDGLSNSAPAPPSGFAERQRQAFLGYPNLPDTTTTHPLRVHVLDSLNRDHMRIGVNEFQTFVNCLPTATVCSEARALAADFCREQVKLVDLLYTIDKPDEPIPPIPDSPPRPDSPELPDAPERSYSPKSPDFDRPFIPDGAVDETETDGPQHDAPGIVALKDDEPTSDAPEKPKNLDDEIPKDMVQPTTVMITTAQRKEDGPPGFDSPAHLVSVLDRVFGNCVEHVILNAWYETWNSHEQIYWPHNSKTWKLEYGTPKFTSDLPRENLYMTPQRTLHVNRDLYRENDFQVNELYRHLLKYHELLDAQPRLKTIQTQLHTYSWDDVLLTKIKATNKEGVLWVDWKDVQIGRPHDFTEAGSGRREKYGVKSY